MKLTKRNLKREYLINKKSMPQIAKMVGCHYSKIFRAMKKFNIKTRTNSEAKLGKLASEVTKAKMRKRFNTHILTKKLLTELYINQEKSTTTIAKELKISNSTIWKYLIKYKIRIRTKGELKHKYAKGRTKHYCIDCGKPICYNSYHSGSGRCRSCSNRHTAIKLFKNMENHPRWLGGISFAPYPLGWTKTFKEQIRYRDGYTCQLCGCPETECRRKLDVHHKDYDKDNLAPTNLISLCHSCHMKTNTNAINRVYWTEFFNNKKVKNANL